MKDNSTNKYLLTAILLFATPGLSIAASPSPRLGAAEEFDIGGGGFFGNTPTTINTVPVLDLGAGWDMNMECGGFDPQVSLGNQLNGVTDGFTDMMSSVISSATSAVASLPALAIQRANPGLYDMLQQGILQGKMDFEWAETSCDQMGKIMSGEESFPFEKYKLSAKVNNWTGEIAASGGDAIAAKNAVDTVNHGDDGAEWVCGTKAGGAGQQPIKALSDVVKVGYNIMFDRANICDSTSISTTTGTGSPLWEYWPSPAQAALWARRVVGEADIRTCDGCKKLSGEPGKGLTYMHRDLADDLKGDLTDLVDASVLLSWQNLNRVSAPPSVIVRTPVIHAIRKRSPQGQTEMIDKLSSEIAYARIVEQGRLLAQMLRTGVKEPNVAVFEPAKSVVNEAIDHLKTELDFLDKEIATRNMVVKESLQRLLVSEEKNVQEVRKIKSGKGSGITKMGAP